MAATQSNTISLQTLLTELKTAIFNAGKYRCKRYGAFSEKPVIDAEFIERSILNIFEKRRLIGQDCKDSYRRLQELEKNLKQTCQDSYNQGYDYETKLKKFAYEELQRNINFARPKS